MPQSVPGVWSPRLAKHRAVQASVQAFIPPNASTIQAVLGAYTLRSSRFHKAIACNQGEWWQAPDLHHVVRQSA